MNQAEHEIKLNLKEKTYPIYIGHNLNDCLSLHIQQNIKGKKAVLITHPTLADLYAKDLKSILDKHISLKTYLIDEGESSKSWESIETLLDFLLEQELERGDCILALGGGVIGDLIGFAASIYKRGIAVYQIPTSLLAQVDASIGGKTGINTTHGKNLVGSFYQPKAVICDLAYLNSLPQEEIKNGFAEIIKYAFICNKDIYNLLLEHKKSFSSYQFDTKNNAFIDLVYHCAKSKSDVVSSDEKEAGLREILNFGHSIGHVIEKNNHFQIPHGKAVAFGMLIECALAYALGKLDLEIVYKLKTMLGFYHFLDDLDESVFDQLHLGLTQDKKAKQGKVPILIPEHIGNHQKIWLPDQHQLKDMLELAKEECLHD